MPLNYLDFDYSEDAQGNGTFDAMVSTSGAHVDAVRLEISLVLDWAHETFPGLRAPLDEGGEWDYELTGQQEWSVPEMLSYDDTTRQLSSQTGQAGAPRHTVTLSIGGGPQFCEAFRRRFAI